LFVFEIANYKTVFKIRAMGLERYTITIIFLLMVMLTCCYLQGGPFTKWLSLRSKKSWNIGNIENFLPKWRVFNRNCKKIPVKIRKK